MRTRSSQTQRVGGQDQTTIPKAEVLFKLCCKGKMSRKADMWIEDCVLNCSRNIDWGRCFFCKNRASVLDKTKRHACLCLGFIKTFEVLVLVWEVWYLPVRLIQFAQIKSRKTNDSAGFLRGYFGISEMKRHQPVCFHLNKANGASVISGRWEWVGAIYIGDLLWPNEGRVCFCLQILTWGYKDDRCWFLHVVQTKNSCHSMAVLLPTSRISENADSMHPPSEHLPFLKRLH